MKTGPAGRSRVTLARSPGLGPRHRVRDEVRRQVHLRSRDLLAPQPGEELGARSLREVD